MEHGKTISLYLVNGNPLGIICAYLSNWTGQAIKVPRNILEKAKNRKEVNTSGIYFLIGIDQKEEIPLVYIGESENVFERLKSHEKNKEFWDEAIIFSSKDDFLTKGHLKYLEAKLIDTLNKSVEYKLRNTKLNEKSLLPEMSKADMDIFFDNLKIVLPTLGHKIFEENDIIKNEHQSILTLIHKEIEAKGYLTTKGFVVKKNSEFKKNIKVSLSNGYTKLRKRLIELKKLIEKGDRLIASEDIEFNSPSEAGSIITGTQINGRKYWKNKYGRSLKDIEKES